MILCNNDAGIKVMIFLSHLGSSQAIIQSFYIKVSSTIKANLRRLSITGFKQETRRAQIKHNSFCQLIRPSFSTLRTVRTEKYLPSLARNKESRAKWTEISQETIIVSEMIDLRLKFTFLVSLGRPIKFTNEEINDLVSFSVSICSILFMNAGSSLLWFRHLKYNAEKSCVFIFDQKKPRVTLK